MLKSIDLKRKLDKDEYKSMLPEMESSIGQLQRQAKELGVPVIIVFDGWDTAGKGDLINKLVLNLDPRGVSLISTQQNEDFTFSSPFLQQAWSKIPERGRISIFEKSWYNVFALDMLNGNPGNLHKGKILEHITSFERQLSEDNYIIIKFFLHISKKEQAKRIAASQEDPATAPFVTKSVLKNHKKYEDLQCIYEEIIEKTDTSYAPWTIVESHDLRFATTKIFSTITNTLKIRLGEEQKDTIKPCDLTKHEIALASRPFTSSILDRVELDIDISKEEYEAELSALQKKAREMHMALYRNKIASVLVFEGWDAAGKGGTVKRLVRSLDPREYQVVPIAAPDAYEKKHHYLWRFWTNFPTDGYMKIFDRSWYGRLLVERVENFCTEDEWRRAYREINEMEEHLTDHGVIVLKFWLHIDKDTQLQRFTERQENTDKNWKITDEDWRNREKWDEYKFAVDEMLFRTDTSYAPWTIVESKNKYHARLKTLRTFINAAEKALAKK